MEIKINEDSYPIALTMGACLDFHEATGKELDNVTGISDMGKVLYYATKATCRARQIKFDMSLEKFSDKLDLEYASEVFMELCGSTNTSNDAKKKGV